jgi:hypothetical protein
MKKFPSAKTFSKLLSKSVPKFKAMPKTKFGKLNTYTSKAGYTYKGKKILSGRNKGKIAIFYSLAFLFLLSPLTGFAQVTETELWNSAGGYDFEFNSGSGEMKQNISCAELYQGDTGEEVISSIQLYFRKYSYGAETPVNIKVYNNYDTTPNTLLSTSHLISTGQDGWFTFTIPEVNREVCSGELAVSIEATLAWNNYTKVNISSVPSSGFLDSIGGNPIFDLGFIVSGYDPTPPPPPQCPEGYTGEYPNCVPPPEPEEMNTAMQYGLNLILLALFIGFGVKFFSSIKGGVPSVSGSRSAYDKQKKKDYATDMAMTIKKDKAYYKKRHGRY